MEDHQKLILSDHDIMPLPELTDTYISGLEKRCNTYSGTMAQGCWTEMAEMYAHKYMYNPDKVFTGCSEAKTEELIENCYFKGVVAMSVYPTFTSPQALSYLCSYYITKREPYSHCIGTVTSSLMYYSPKFISRGVTFCTAIPSLYQPECFTRLLDLFKKFSTDQTERANLCKVIPDAYKQMCLK